MPSHPKVTLVGKGVCFDTGGLDIKSDAGMLNMKKDMGGAASMLALAHMLMSRGIKLRLRVLIPAVENSISGSAFRPRDVYRSRKGITVEIGNTDAEGRLILADAHGARRGGEAGPDRRHGDAHRRRARRARHRGGAVLHRRRRLRGGARALLPKPRTIRSGGCRCGGPTTRCSNSKVADINNVSQGGFAGSITAALFLRRFATEAKTWLHCDIYAWNQTARPGRPEGGECQAARALYALLVKRYG